MRDEEGIGGIGNFGAWHRADRHARAGGSQGGNGGGDGASFTLKGTIDAPDPDDRTIVVTVVSPLSLAKLNPLTVQTTGETRFKECDGSKISFGDLASGDIIKVAGVVDGETFIATRVILQYSLPE